VVSQEEKTNWRIQTDFLILTTEYEDGLYRKKHPNHKCNKGWYDSGGGRWFCEHLIKARRKNKELRKKWIENLFESPLLNQSPFIRKIANTIYPCTDGR